MNYELVFEGSRNALWVSGLISDSVHFFDKENYPFYELGRALR